MKKTLRKFMQKEAPLLPAVVFDISALSLPGEHLPPAHPWSPEAER